jgi:hypothetical protein
VEQRSERLPGHLRCGSENEKHSFFFTKQQQQQQLPTGDKTTVPHAVALLIFDNLEDRKNFHGKMKKREQKFSAVPLLPSIIESIKKNLVDLVVYAKDSKFSRCGLFEDLVPKWKGKHYVLRERDGATHPNLSRSRCTIKWDTFFIKVLH